MYTKDIQTEKLFVSNKYNCRIFKGGGGGECLINPSTAALVIYLTIACKKKRVLFIQTIFCPHGKYKNTFFKKIVAILEKRLQKMAVNPKLHL